MYLHVESKIRNKEAKMLTVVLSGSGMLMVVLILHPFPCFLSFPHAGALVF